MLHLLHLLLVGFWRVSLILEWHPHRAGEGRRGDVYGLIRKWFGNRLISWRVMGRSPVDIAEHLRWEPLLETPLPVTPPVTPVTSGPPALPALTVVGKISGAGSADGMVMDEKGNLFGVVELGGSGGNGAIVEIVAGSGVVSTLASLSGGDGSQPVSGLMIDAKGNLYGTTSAGGSAGNGTIYMLAKGSGSITTLASFSAKDGKNPVGPLVMDRAGNLFGTMASGGANDMGTVFELGKRNHRVQLLSTFDGTNGANPIFGLTLDARGNLYGVAEGSETGKIPATVFEVLRGNHLLKTLATLGVATSPIGTLVTDSKGDMFGVLNAGGTNHTGAVFELAKGSSSAAIIASFSADTGLPLGGLLMDKGGNLFGTYSHDAAAPGSGGLFEIVAGSGTITRLAASDGNVAGSTPQGTLMMDKNGTLYGAAYSPLPENTTTVFSFTPTATISAAGELVIQHEPSRGKDGSVSVKAAVVDASGNVITGGTFSVTLSVASGPAGAGIFTPVTVQTVDGVADFEDVALPSVAGTYKLQVAEGSLAPVVTRAIVVKAAGKGKHC